MIRTDAQHTDSHDVAQDRDFVIVAATDHTGIVRMHRVYSETTAFGYPRLRTLFPLQAATCCDAGEINQLRIGRV